ncbi:MULTISPECIES: ferredoxin [Streptomyces]|uniref:Ferredoxin n=1 Tax=Streptomyces cacaoi TaxID=1898 RepID=A0A4Y3QRS1_STRCI|nr:MULTISPECIES: ferredoxin [Streptomyces]NNG88213.1 ferredoxin [Streptomyces cacaoi]QHF95574.1 ferredoxin [Streptomyces sp. NHF165]GEB47995.1 ferredoxin [Streptomyces cacaoi]
MRVEVDRPRCVASGQCVLVAPDVFDQDDDGIVVTLDERPDAPRHEDVREAAAICPAAAIALREE